jgi:hypothetical protein
LKLLLLLAFIALSALLLAQDKKPNTQTHISFPADTPSEAPAISADLRSKYWRAQNEMNLAELALAKATLDVEHRRETGRAVMLELQKSCGANLPLVLTAAGEPTCTPNPPLPIPAETPAEK